MSEMFDFQCEQTAGCTGETARLRDALTGALVGLARATENTQPAESTYRAIIEGLYAALPDAGYDEDALRQMTDTVHAEKAKLAPGCSTCASPCGRTADYDLQELWNADEDVRSLKALLLFGIRGMAARAYRAAVPDYTGSERNRFFCEALYRLGYEKNVNSLLSALLKAGAVNLKNMEQTGAENNGSEAVLPRAGELPDSFVLPWHGQETACVILSLMKLGIKNIPVEPALPAFLSTNVRRILAEEYGVTETEKR